MVINGKLIQESTKKVAKISMEISLDFAKAHPYISSTTIFLLLLYLCFPGLFWFIVCSAGFISFAKIYINIKNANAKISGTTDVKKSDENSSSSSNTSISTKKLVRNDAHARSVRRRRPRELPPVEEEEKKTICSSNVIEEAPKVIREVQVEPVASSSPPSAGARGQTSPALNRWRSLRMKKFSFSGKGDLEISDSDEDERDKEENKKAVQWNENDQKNLQDLGLSEIERNKRLESLIARRRSRKMFSLQVRRSLMNMDRSEQYNRMNSIQVPRGNHFNPEKQTSGQFSPMPGSAPSFFRPANPFDIPYDPQEEKPILTGGSFHQEFDVLSKHESFNLGTYCPGEKLFQDDKEEELPDFHGDHPSIMRIRENLKMALGSEESDKIIEMESSPEQPDFKDCTCASASGRRAPHPSLDLTHSSSSCDLGQISKEIEGKKSNGETESGPSESGRRAPHPSLDLKHCVSSSDLREIPEGEEKMRNGGAGAESGSSNSEEEDEEEDEPVSRIDRVAILEILAVPLMQRNFSFKEEISRNENKMEDQARFLFPPEAMYHKQNVSIASDLQVECSEIGSSPPLSPHGEEERIESRLRDIHEVREGDDATSIELSGEHMNKPEKDEKIIQESHDSNISDDNHQTYEFPAPEVVTNPVLIEEYQVIFHHPNQPDGANHTAQSSQDQEASASESIRFLPRSIAQHLNVGSHSSSPKSVLQPKFSMDHIHRSPSNLSEELHDETQDSIPVSPGLSQEHSNPTSTSPESSAEEETNSRIHEPEPEPEPGGNTEAALERDTADEIKEVDHIAYMVTREEALQPPGTGRPIQED